MHVPEGVVTQQPVRTQNYNPAGYSNTYLSNGDFNIQSTPQKAWNTNTQLPYQQAGIPSGFNPQPTVQQPWCTNPSWPPARNSGSCPRGLEYLVGLDQVLVKQSKELLEIVTGFETNNKYKILNSMGQQIYTAEEDTDCCTRACLGAVRPFEINISDMQREVLHVSRPFNCILQEVSVFAPCEDNIELGQVNQECTCCCVPDFAVFDDTNQKVFSIDGPACGCNCCSDVDFVVKGLDGTSEVGHIRKQWTGYLQESVTDADNFGVTFPIDLDVKLKAVLIGATFLIDFVYFESNQQRHHQY